MVVVLSEIARRQGGKIKREPQSAQNNAMQKFSDVRCSGSCQLRMSEEKHKRWVKEIGALIGAGLLYAAERAACASLLRVGHALCVTFFCLLMYWEVEMLFVTLSM